MRGILTVTAIVLATQISGCSSQWLRNSLQAEELSIATSICEKKAETKFPVKNQVAQITNYKSEKEPSKTGLIPYINSYIMDVNKDSRRHLFYNCMRQKGWQFEI